MGRSMGGALATLSAVTLLGLAAMPGPAAAASCAPTTNIEAIIDDSGSMSITDPTGCGSRRWTF